MTPSLERSLSVGVLVVTLMGSAGLVARLTRTPPTPDRAHAATPPPRSVDRAAAMPRTHGFWADPSVPSDIRDRAFAPPPSPESLPPEARPQKLAIRPSASERRALSQDPDLVGY